jgi:hypothetical protein
MVRVLFCALTLAVVPLTAVAEATVTEAETLIRLGVQPMAAPQPALRYLLLPELKEMSPGNPIPNYLRCLMDQDVAANEEVLHRSALQQADRAARMDKPDWQILPKLKTDGFNLLLPDVQKMRTLAAALQKRFHTEVTQGRLDDALVTAKTMFALSRHMGEHPTLIGDLVAIAIAFITIVPLEEMLEQPACPNLYWALTNLPHPLISLGNGLEGERMMVLVELHDLVDTEPMSAAQIDKLSAHIDKLRNDGPNGRIKWNTRKWLSRQIKDDKLVEAARRRLVQYGIPEERLARFAAEQVILLDEKRQYEVSRDEVMKLVNLPPWQIEAMTDGAKPPVDAMLFGPLGPALKKVFLAQGRLEQRVALLRCVEALRLYAAEHEGRLPEKLSDIRVPLPEDPFTGKPFRYEVNGDTAHIRGRPPRGVENIAAYNIHYEITIRR